MRNTRIQRYTNIRRARPQQVWESQEGSDPFGAGFKMGNGATALHAAVENGYLDTTRLLLEEGAVQSDSMEGATPLMSASMYNRSVGVRVDVQQQVLALTTICGTGASAGLVALVHN